MTPPPMEPAFVPTVPPPASADRLRILSARTLTFTPSSVPVHAPSTASGPRTLTQPFPQRADTRPYPDGAVGKGTGTVLVLFRGDLRLHDHAALTHAIEEARTVVPVYVFDTRQFGSSPAGFQRTGKYRARFLVESVQALRASLESIGGGLIVRTGLPEKIIPELARQTRAKRVFVHKEINVDELNVESKLVENLKEHGAELQRFWSNTLYYEDDLPFSIDDMPDVYTDFREAVDARGQIREPLPAPDKISPLPRGVEEGRVPSLADLGIVDAFEQNERRRYEGGVGAISGGEEEALKRLRSFAEERRFAASEYGSDLGSGATPHAPDFACRISPWLALGCLSPRLIFDEMQRVSKSSAKSKCSYTYFELVWRDFFRCITAKYSQRRVSKLKSEKVAV